MTTWPVTMQQLVLARAADRAPGLVVDDRRWSWAEVVAEGLRRAGWLDQRWRPGGPRHVGVLLDNQPEFVFHLCAAALAGSVVVGLNTTRRGEDLARDVRHADCQLVLTDPEHAPLLEGLDLGPARGRVVDVTGSPYLTEVAAEDAGIGPRPAVGDTDLFMLIFTSGTTGAPKAVRCSQGKIATQGRGLADRVGLGHADVAYLSMPLFHSNAIIAGWTPTLAVGATAALAPRFSASGFLPDVRRYGATYANYVGTPLSYVLAQPARPDDGDNPLRVVFGNEASPWVIDEFARRFTCSVHDGFGSTEGGLSVGRTPDTPPGSIGRPVGDVRVLHPDTGEECPPARFDEDGGLLNAAEAIGELVNLDGVGAFEGYYRNDEATVQRTRGGHYHSGDLAYRDAEGFYYHAGRTGDWVRVRGENVATAAIERALLQHPDVVATAVYAVPDPDAGDQVMAAVELATRCVFDGAAMGRWIADHPGMAPRWRPRYVRVSPALPTTATNKVLVRELAAEGLRTEDPIWVDDPGPDHGYRRLEAHDLDALERSFAASGRGHLAP